jgi:hypothetical protein
MIKLTEINTLCGPGLRSRPTAERYNRWYTESPQLDRRPDREDVGLAQSAAGNKSNKIQHGARYKLNYLLSYCDCNWHTVILFTSIYFVYL